MSTLFHLKPAIFDPMHSPVAYSPFEGEEEAKTKAAAIAEETGVQYEVIKITEEIVFQTVPKD